VAPLRFCQYRPYLKAGLFVVTAAAALFAPAGTFAIAACWVYLAIFAVVIIVSFAALIGYVPWHYGLCMGA
jgi:hypothetical protein